MEMPKVAQQGLCLCLVRVTCMLFYACRSSVCVLSCPYYRSLRLPSLGWVLALHEGIARTARCSELSFKAQKLPAVALCIAFAVTDDCYCATVYNFGQAKGGWSGRHKRICVGQRVALARLVHHCWHFAAQ